MNEFSTVAFTVISGVIVYVSCEYIKEIWLMPLQEYKTIKKKVSYTLAMLASYYANPIDLSEADPKQLEPYKEAATNMRVVASELRSFIETISWLNLGIPDENKIYEASGMLIRLSNSFFTPYRMPERSGSQAVRNKDDVHEVSKLLNLHSYKE